MYKSSPCKTQWISLGCKAIHPKRKTLYIDQRPEQKTNSQINYRLLLIRIKTKKQATISLTEYL